MYNPLPINTDGIKLDKEIVELSEILAKNTHEVWAKGRIEEGWKFGTKRDDVLKTHPGLVPYEDLSDEEKDYDRRTSEETLKLIIKLGYKIEKGE